MNNKLIFIGPIRVGELPRGGDTMKNHIFLERFKTVFDEVIIVDTIDWKIRPWIFLKMLSVLLFVRNAKVVISCESGAASIIKFLYYFRLQKEVFYWVVGCGFPTRIGEGKLKANHFHFLKKIIVQSPDMVRTLNDAGLNNAVYIPNSKPIYSVSAPHKEDSVIRFVFLSRIVPSKGIEYILNSTKRLNEDGLQSRFKVIFYGNSSDYPEFIDLLKGIDNVVYYGLLDLTKKEGYESLAVNDIMLFPTFYEGEGFPGVCIDAFISGLPIVATDWHCNKDIVSDGINGFIIPPKDEDALYVVMKKAIEGRIPLESMKRACYDEAKKYDCNYILSENELKKLGLL